MSSEVNGVINVKLEIQAGQLKIPYFTLTLPCHLNPLLDSPSLPGATVNGTANTALFGLCATRLTRAPRQGTEPPASHRPLRPLTVQWVAVAQRRRSIVGG